jgi:hypothetical protein
MSKTTVDSLQKEHEQDEALERSFTGNPYKTVIQALFKDEFSGTKYRKYDKTKMLALIEEKLAPVNATYHGVYLPGGQALIRNLKKAKTVEDILMKMNEYLFA